MENLGKGYLWGGEMLYSSGMFALDRTAVIVTAKQPFLDWLKSVDDTGDDLTLADLNRDQSLYLLPESDDDAAAKRSLRKSCGDIFEEQLDGWWRDESVWPKDRSFRVFTRWFDYRFHSMVFDLVQKAPVREAD